MSDPMTPAQQYLADMERLGGEAKENPGAFTAALHNSREAVGRVIRAAAWARKAHEATGCPDARCDDGRVPEGLDPDGHWTFSQCEWCAMCEEISDSLDALPVEAQPEGEGPTGAIPGVCFDIDGDSWHKDGDECAHCGFPAQHPTGDTDEPSV